METTNKHSDNKSKMEVYVQLLPSAEVKMFTTSPEITIRDLKILSEEKWGIPSDVLYFMHNAVVLDEITTLLDLGSSEYMLLDLFIQSLWEKFIYCCFKGESDRVLARVHIRMNQLTPEVRAFVAAFIAAHKGNSELFQLMIESFKEQVIFQTVGLSRRSLLHASVLGGNINCVMTLVINGGWKLLNQADKQQEVPLDMAQRKKKEEGLIQILTKYNDMYTDRHWEKGEETSKSDSRGTKLPGDDSRQYEKLFKNLDVAPTVEGKERKMLPVPPTQGKPEESPAGRGQRLLQRGETPRPKLHIPAPGEQNKAAKSPTKSPKSPIRHHINIKRAESLKLPGIYSEERKSTLVAPRFPRGSLHRNVVERPRSPSSPTPRAKYTPPKLVIERPRTRTECRPEERCDVQITDGPPQGYFSSSAPNSPNHLRKRQTLPVSSLARPRSPSGCRSPLSPDQEEPRFFSRQLQVHLMAFDKTRGMLPWNAWKAVREDDSSTRSSDEEDDEEGRIRRYQQMSGHRKSFEVWLTAKEDQKVKEHTQAETEAKRLAEQKSLEETQRRMRAKTFDEWLKEKTERVEHKAESDVEAERDARRAQASFKYQQWMKKKDEEALAREEKIRAEEQRKYEELKKKREEEERVRWLKKPLGKVNSVPIN